MKFVLGLPFAWSSVMNQRPPGHPKNPEIKPSTPQPEQVPFELPEVYPQKTNPEIEPKQPGPEVYPNPSPQISPDEVPHEFPDTD